METKIRDKNGFEFFISIEIKENKLLFKIKSPINPIMSWSYNATYEELMKSQTVLSIFENVNEIRDFLIENVNEGNFQWEFNDESAHFFVELKQFKKKIPFLFIVDEIKDPKAMFMELSQIIMSLNARIEKPFYKDSEILHQDELETIKNWIDPNKKRLKLTLLYSGKRDTFGTGVFHSKTNGKTPTLILVESHLKKRFGGYAKEVWDSTNNYKKDNKAFLFSLTHNLKFNENGANSNSIYCHSSHGPTFGGGHDFYCADNCSANFNSYSNFGNNYSKENIGNIHPQCVLAGSYNFAVVGLEVFSVEL